MTGFVKQENSDMRTTQTDRRAGLVCALTALLLAAGVAGARAQNPPPPGQQTVTVDATPAPQPSFEIYGFAMLDIGHDFKQIHPDWSDTLRVTKLPKVADEFGEDNNTFAGVRQSRLGVRSSTPTDLGELKTIFEFELFGTGVDYGQTRSACATHRASSARFGAGQDLEPFRPDVFPNSLEYWGPTGMAFFRNVQVRWTPVKGRDTAT